MTTRRLARNVPMTMRALLVTACLALAAAGCGGGDEKTTSSGGGGGGGGGDELAGPLTFSMTGGDAFRQDRITVRPDGSAQVKTLKGDVPVELTDKELSAVNDQIDRLADVPENSTTDPPIPDGLSYVFEYEGREVSTDSGSLPEGLEPLIGTFIKLVDRYGQK